MSDARQSPFAIVPVEAALDQRLGAMQYRVLIAILSFRAKNSDSAFPKRERLAARTGYTITTISKVTAQLEALGWLEKQGRGGRSAPTHYKVRVPETVADPETVSSSETVSGSGTVVGSGTVAGSGSKTVSDPDTGKEQTTEQTNPPPCSPPSRSYPEWFEHLWSKVPRRSGANSKKQAYGCVNARLREGWTMEVIDAGLERYVAWCTATDKIGTEKVMQARTFFGPEDPPHFTHDWNLPTDHAQRSGATSATETVAERMAQREQERQRETQGDG